MSEDYIWGLTLDKNKTSETWDPDPDLKPDANESAQSYRGEHSLIVKQALLGADAKDGEVNVVEVEAMGYRADVKFPIAVLKAGSTQQSVLDVLFPDPPVTFKLVKGSGPVHLIGNHSIGSGETLEDDDEVDEDDLEFDEEDMDEIEEMSDKNNVEEKKRKLAASNSNPKGKSSKKAKVSD
ncbi:nucleoplasmin-like protein isoform X1 [Bemisia tabaci]|nr:PREDICTED: nucleoplasmin-like protein isoform X1 [Bemisia tabaci]